MKKLRLVTFLGLGIFAFYLSAIAQANWSGTWIDGVITTNISGSGNSLSASFTYKGDGYSGSGSWTGCKVEGNSAKCNWIASHDDDTKSGTRKGTLDVTLGGNTITGSYFEDTPQWTYKAGYSASNVTSSMYKGAVHAINLKRSGAAQPSSPPANARPSTPPATTQSTSANCGNICEVTVVSVVPGVVVHKAGRPPDEWVEVGRDTVLRMGDQISCDPDGAITLRFANGETTVVQHTTQLTLATYFTEGGIVHGEIMLKMGEVAARINKSEATKSDFHIKSPSCASSVRGTAFTVRYDPPTQATTISVQEDEVYVEPTNTALRSFTLKAGQQVRVTMNNVSPVTPTIATGGGSARPISNCFASDAGAGNTDRNAQARWAEGRDSQQLAANLEAKLDMLSACRAMSDAQLANVFGEISVTVAKYASNASCFNGDAGIVATDAAAHRNWALQTGRLKSFENLEWKVSRAFRCVARPNQAAYFADVSVAIAKGPAN
jgi:hypothetical protein